MLDVHGEGGGGVALWANRGIPVARGNACKLNYSRVRAFFKKTIGHLSYGGKLGQDPNSKITLFKVSFKFVTGSQFCPFWGPNIFFCLTFSFSFLRFFLK